MADITNATEADDIGELERLLRAKLIDGLNTAAPSASLMAVAQKFLAEKKAQRPQQSARAMPDATSFPFPSTQGDPAKVPPERDPEAVRKALAQPFVTTRLPFPALGSRD